MIAGEAAFLACRADVDYPAADKLCLHLHEEFLWNDRFVVAFDVVLRDGAVVLDSLFRQEVCGIGLLEQSIAVYEAKTAQLKEKIEKTVVTKADIMNSKTVDFIRKMAYLLFPEDIRDNGKYAFYDFSGLEDISIDCFATKVTDYSFIGSRGFSSISIPDGVTSIGKYCFYGCSDLTEAYIPESVTSIGTGSFRSCNNDFTLYVYEGSYAEKYAKANNMKYVKLLDVKTNAPEYSYVGDTVDLQAFASGTQEITPTA